MVKYFLLVLIFIAAFVLDQVIKNIILDGFRWQSEFIDIVLVYNKGVAFSMLSFLGDYLKYIQIAFLILAIIFIFYDKSLHCFLLPLSLLFGAGSSNIFDRFIHEGVVDFIFWHKWFNFAIFNSADVMINLALAWIVVLFLLDRKNKNGKEQLQQNHVQDT